MPTCLLLSLALLPALSPYAPDDRPTRWNQIAWAASPHERQGSSESLPDEEAAEEESEEEWYGGLEPAPFLQRAANPDDPLLGLLGAHRSPCPPSPRDRRGSPRSPPAASPRS